MAEYIERDIAIKSLQLEVIGEADQFGIVESTLVCAQKKLFELPAADVAPVVHGRWEPCFEDWRKQIEGDRCSACGFEHYGACISDYNYCPNCGAKMDLEE